MISMILSISSDLDTNQKNVIMTNLSKMSVKSRNSKVDKNLKQDKDKIIIKQGE